MKQFPPRIFVFVVLLWLAIAAAMATGERSRLRYLEAATTTQMEADRNLWNIVHKLSDDSLSSSVSDYTFWDDMAQFAEGTRDLRWAHENLDPSLASFDVDALWVFGPDGTLRYSVMRDGGVLKTPPLLPLDLAALKKLMSAADTDYGVMHEFYWFSDVGPLTVIGSDITSTDDPMHTKPSRGYYFAARRLTMQHGFVGLSGIGATAEAVALTEIPPDEPPSGSKPHVFWHEMRDYRGTLIGAIRVERYAPNFVSLTVNSERDRLLTASLWLATGLGVSGLLFVLGLTQRRAASLAEQMTRQLRESNTRLEQRVAERTAELAADIEKRKKFEEQLERRTHELETMNRAMLDREDRIIELKQQLEMLKRQ